MPEAGGGKAFAAARRRFADAFAAADGGATRSGPFAGTTLRIALAGAALARRLGPTFAYLPPSVPAAPVAGPSIELWDCAAAAMDPPPVPAQAEWAAAGEGWRVTSHDDGRFLCEERGTSLLWLDRAASRIVGCFADARVLGCADRARPLQRIMSEFCRSLHIQEVHAGMVAREGRGVLIVGGGGRGKSTSSLDGLAGDLDFLGDDSVGLGEDRDGRPQGHCLYASARVLPRQQARWPALAGHWQDAEPPELKTLVQPATIAPERIARTAAIVAVAVPAVTDLRLRITPASPLDVFNALAHDSRDNRRFGLTAREFARLAGLIRAVPCHRLEVDADPARVAAACRALIDGGRP